MLLAGPLLAAVAAAAPSASPGADRAEAIYRYLLARRFEGDGEFGKARGQFEAAVEADPKDGGLRLEFARFLRGLGLVDQSLVQAGEAVRLEPENARAWRFLGETRAAGGKGDADESRKAVEAFRKGNLPDEGSPSELSIFADALLTAGEEAEAAEAYRRLFSIAPQVPEEIRFRAAEAFVRSGADEEGETIYREALAKDPGDPRAIFFLAGILERRGDYVEAAALLAPLSDRRPENLQLRAQLGWLYARGRRWNQAIALLEKVIETDAKNRTAREYLAVAYTGAARYDDAAKLYRQLVAETPDDLEIAWQAAVNLVGAGRSDDAMAAWVALEKQARSKPGRVEVERGAVTQRAVLLWNVRDGEGALALLRPELERMPTAAVLSLALEIFRAGRRWDEALGWIARGREHDPASLELTMRDAQFRALAGDPSAADDLACRWAEGGRRDEMAAAWDLLQRLGRFGEAAEVAEQGRFRFPDSKEWIFRHGSALERSGRRRESEAAFRELIRRDPDHAGALNYLGYMLADAGERLDEAERMIRRAVELDPGNAAYQDSLGWVYFRKGKLPEADEWLRLAARGAPDDWAVQDHLGDLAAARGDAEGARNAWRRALELTTTAPEAEPQRVDALRRKLQAAERR